MEIINKVGVYKQAGREWYTRNVNTITKFSVHHDAIPHSNKTAEQVLSQIMAEHVNRGWPGASYHFYIHVDGKIYQLNKFTEVTWVDGINWDCLGIVMNGYFHPDYNNKPTQAQLNSLKELLDHLSTQHPEFPADQSGVVGHRERAATACPGNEFFPYVKEYREKMGDVNWGSQPVPTPTPTPGQPITAQTKIPANLLNSNEYPVTEDKEVQAIKSDLQAMANQIKSLEGDKVSLENRLKLTKEFVAGI